MASENSEKVQETCFVVMGFGKKTDFETGRTLDLNASYRNMIKPAVEAAGLKCIRADEIVHSGVIDVPMYEQLLNADFVVADLSTSNKNAFYELGVRHALRPYTTVVIAEDGIKTFPFDVNHVVVRQYHHMGEDIGYAEVMRFRELLTTAIVTLKNKRPPENVDSPVYTFLSRLTPPTLAALQAAAGIPPAQGQEEASRLASAPADGATLSMIMQLVEEAQQKGDFLKAKTLLSAVLEDMKKKAPQRPEDPSLVQRLALLTYKSKLPSEEEALKEACDLLAALDPETSNDTETLGLWGAVHKRLWQLTRNRKNLDDAVRAYERGFYLRNDYYNGINFAYLLNVRSAASADPGEAIADFVQARRVRKEVLSICQHWLAANEAPDKQAPEEAVKEYKKARYWVLATMGEACLGLEDEAQGRRWLEEAYGDVPEGWMRESTEAQIDKLAALLADSPMRYLQTGARPQPAAGG
jgi:tetratricopeptide (TPR) repeat protein